MVALPQKTRLTEAEYLAFERKSETKHEYMDGEVFAMTGASRAHNLIGTNLTRIIGTQLRGKGCEIYAADMRVKIGKKYVYPDVTVVCGEAQFADDEFDNLLNPTVIFEILSDTTESYDRGTKSENYRKLPSLQEYVLVAQHKPHIERYLRLADGTWNLKEANGLEGSLELTSIGCTLQLAEVYEQVSFITTDSTSATQAEESENE
jgi:Uma2 family endonuclease